MRHRPITCLDVPIAGAGPYYLGQDIVADFPAFVQRYDFDCCFLVTSRKLFHRFGERLRDTLVRARRDCEVVLIRETERNKNWKTLQGLCERLVAQGATKDSCLIALGGGVIGNIVGLTAALLYRGVRFVEVPTTVMAQTDSTLSNKQAINGRRGKNQFGVYHAPVFVWTDTAYAAAEPPRQQRSGIVEGIKNVLVSQSSLEAAEAMLAEWEAGDQTYELVRRLIESKLWILRQDTSELGSSIILEYGHTFGHAIEWLSDGRLYHGEAIAIGMCLAAEVSHGLGYMPKAFLLDHYRLLGERLRVPTRRPSRISLGSLLRAMRVDNKRTKKGLRFLLLRQCGEFVNPEGDYLVSIPPKQLRYVLNSIVTPCDEIMTDA